MGVCAGTDSIEVVEGTTVYYCYEVMNMGELTLTLHDLDDDQLGMILEGFAYALGPGASADTVAAGLTLSATVTSSITNTAVWTAYNDAGASVSYTDTATVTVTEPTDVNLSGFGGEAGPVAWPVPAIALTILLLGAALVLRRQTSA